jgi:hypothetical protein
VATSATQAAAYAADAAERRYGKAVTAVAQDWPKSGTPLVGKGALVPLTPTLATAVATAGSRTPKSKLEESNKETVLIWHIAV